MSSTPSRSDAGGDHTDPTMLTGHVDTARMQTDQPDADALVLFGSTGDLAVRKLFPALYRLARSGVLTVPVIGVARSDWTDDDFRRHARESVIEHIDDPDPAVLDELCRRLDLVQGDYADENTWNTLRATLDKHNSMVAVFYMAIPPSMFPMVAQKLASVDLHHRGRIVVEKPFGRDLQSAIELNRTLHEVFAEDHIFRIDHYLGKEAVEGGAQLVPRRLVGVVALDEVEAPAQRVDDVGVRVVDVFIDRLAGVAAEVVVGPVAAGDTDHRDVECARPFQPVQRREELAYRKITGRTEEHQRVGPGLAGLHTGGVDVGGPEIAHRVGSLRSA